MNRVLITGAAGDIGGRLRRLLTGAYPVLRLSDIEPIADSAPDSAPDSAAAEEIDRTDLTDLEAVTELCRGVDGIVHLGGFAQESSWEVILKSNIIGTYNLFEAARRQGVKRAIFASSNHAVGFYRRDQTIGPDVTPLPDSHYGVSKAFGESLGALYSHKHGLEVLCIRIGNVNDRPIDKRRLSIWISPRDLAQLVRIGLDHPDLGFKIVYGASDNARGWWDNSIASDLGYRPQDRAEDFAAEVLAAEPPAQASDPSELYQGGTFVR